MFPLWFALLGGSFVFLDVGPFILFIVFSLIGCFDLHLVSSFKAIAQQNKHIP